MNTSSIILSVRVPVEIASRLEKLAEAVDCPRSYLAAEGIEEYLMLHEWQVQTIQAGLKEIKQGEVINFSEVKQHWKK